MVSSLDGVLNLDDERAAVVGRTLPGAQVFYIGSPWAPAGPVYQIVTDHFGRPTRNMVVIRAPAPAMNPREWTAERVARVREQNPEAARTDIDAEFAAPESLMFPPDELRAVVRDGPVEMPPVPGWSYEAAIDPATRSNRWTLVVTTRDDDGKRIVCLARDWRPDSAPLRPRAVLSEMAEILRPYGVTDVYTDQYSADALADLALEQGLALFIVARTAPLNLKLYTGLQTRMRTGLLELPNHSQLLLDLGGVTKRPTSAGVVIVLRKTSDGGHCDYAAALSLAMHAEIAGPKDVSIKAEADRMREQYFQQLRDEAAMPGFERAIPSFLRN